MDCGTHCQASIYIYRYIYRNLAEALILDYKLPEEIYAPNTTIGSMRRPRPLASIPVVSYEIHESFFPCTTDSAQDPQPLLPHKYPALVLTKSIKLRKKNFPLNAAGSEEKD